MKKKLLLISVLVLLIVPVAWFGFNIFSGSNYSFVVVSDPGAKIYVATSKDEPFLEIGAGSAEYTTKQTGFVYVQAKRDGSVSVQTVSPVDSDGKVIELKLFETKTPAVLLENPIVDSFLEDGVIYGVDKLTNSMININPTDFVPPKTSYISIPYVSGVIWLNSDNFYYNIFGGGVGSVVNNSNEGAAFLENPFYSYSEVESTLTVDRFKTQPLVILSTNSIYVSDDFGKSMKRIVVIESNENYFFDASKEFIYYGEGLSPSEYATEGDGKEVEAALDGNLTSKLAAYDYSGNAVMRAELQGVTTITGVANHALSSSTLVATDKGLVQLDVSGKVIRLYDFPFALSDITSYENNVFLFSNSDIWLLDLLSGSYSLVYDLGSDVYVADSVQPGETNSEILFTTINNSASSGAIYMLNLK